MILQYQRQQGYIMLPVMLAVALVATIAFMMNMEGSMGAKSISNDLQAEQARYVTEAGLQHAQWQVEQAGCGPYTDISEETFGNHSYSASITPNNAGGQITTYPVLVSDDAWIKSDTPTQNYGNDAQLSTYFSFLPSSTQRTLYRFDIASAGIAPDALVVSAVAKLFVVDSNDSASVTAHQVTADWDESTVNWDNINADHDTSSIASIPSGSPVGEYVSVNITSLVQGWVNGSTANQGIMLKTAWIDDLAQFTSQEYGNTSQRPLLEVKISDGTLSNRASITAQGTLTNGVARSMTREDLVLYQAAPNTLELQPDATEGQDAEIWDQSPNNNYGNAAETWVSSASNDTTRSLLRFNMGAIPAGAGIQGATLSMHRQSGSGADQPVSANRIMNPWSEDSVTWNSRESGTNWDTAGADFDNIAVATTPVGPVNERYDWNITPLVQGWVDGIYPNYGVALTAAIAGMPGERFYTSDHADPSLWPSLNITYACECGVACLAPQGSGRVLLVVGDDVTLAPADSQKKTLFESWGYTVSLIDDEGNQPAFDTAFANNDVVYVSETVSGWTLGDKLNAATIGVVNEEGDLTDNLGTSSNSAHSVGRSLSILDNSHYITELFPLGAMPVYSVDMDGLSAAGALATGLQTLADWGGAPGLAFVDTGGILSDGSSTAPGRRVILPIGRDGDFNWRYLNNNGRLIVQRAIEWGTATADPVSIGASLWLSTLDDVSSSGAPGLDAWTDGEVVAFSDPNLLFEPGTTNGTFSSILNLDNFALDSNADIDASHYVGSDITVGSANSVALLAGDVLLSTANDEKLGSTNLSVANEDVFVFRPDTVGDYSSGTFIFLIDGSQIHGEDTVGISLVEKDTTVGDGLLAKGTFIMALTNRRDVITFPADDVGLNTTSGSVSEFIDGPSLHLGSEVRGFELAEDEITLGGHIIPAGSILLTLNNDGSSVGDNGVAVDSEDIFYLTVTQTGSNPVANATLLFDGSDVNLDTIPEHLQALALTNTVSPTANGPIAHWKLDDGSGGIAIDSEGGHDGTLLGNPTWSTGTLGGALDFDGAGDRVDVWPILDAGAPQISVMAWVFKRDTGDDRVISKSSGIDRPDHIFSLGVADTTVRARLRTTDNGGTSDYDGGAIPLDQWVHLAFTYDGGMLRIYMDGTETASYAVTGDIIASTLDVAIGNVNATDDRYWNGLLDDVRIYDSVLSATEIADLYTEGAGGGGTPEPPPVEDSCNGTYRDEFKAQSYSGSDGTLLWSTDWEETGEVQSPTAGDIYIDTDISNFQLAVRDDGQTIMREADLTGATIARLSFDYRRDSLDSSSEYVDVEVSSDGGLNWNPLDRFVGVATDADYTSVLYDISGYMSANTRIRFLTPASGMGNGDIVWFDNVQIQCWTLEVIPIDPIDPIEPLPPVM